MSSTKIIIICLALLMTFFFIGLSLNLFEKKNQGLEKGTAKDQQKAASEYNQGSWLKSVDSLLAPFAESIDPDSISELELKNCSKTSKGFALNQQTPNCKIEVKGFNDSAFKKLSLKPSSNSRMAKLKMIYKERGKKAGDPSYWPSKDQNNDTISFVIMGKKERQGKTVVTITLTCENNCKNQQKINIIFE